MWLLVVFLVRERRSVECTTGSTRAAVGIIISYNGTLTKWCCVCFLLVQQDFAESKMGSDVIGDRVLGARLHPGLTISENSAEVFSTRFAPEGK